jgi:hypothetical protein
MSGASAKITSVDALGRLKGGLFSFRQGCLDGLTAVQLEVQRFVDWVEHDRAKFWEGQVRRGWDRVAEARSNLERCQMMVDADGRPPACREEQLALEKAKRALRHAEEKVEIVKRWVRALRHEITEYEAREGQLTGWLEGEFPKAVTALERMASALAEYLATTAPVGSETALATGEPSAAASSSPAEVPPSETSPAVAATSATVNETSERADVAAAPAEVDS